MLLLCTTLRPLAVAIAFLTGVAAAAEHSLERVMRDVDRQRLPDGGFEAQLLIAVFREGRVAEEGQYLIRANGSGLALVEALSADQRGQKFLTTSSGLFFFAPRTKRAIRITPLQTLRGQASIGDIARLRLSSDYEPAFNNWQTADCGSGTSCLSLTLSSRHEAATYARIELTVRATKAGYVPDVARLHLASGRLAKTVVYTPGTPGLPLTARYTDAINPQLQTTVVYESTKPARYPDSMFNPRSLEQ